jgi:hypothetical protein
MVHTFLVVGDSVKNLLIPGDRVFRSCPPLLEQLLNPPGDDGGLWMRKVGDLGGVHAELLECRRPIPMPNGSKLGAESLFSILSADEDFVQNDRIF